MPRQAFLRLLPPGALAAAAAVLAACGGSPTSAPGQGAANLPPQTNPAVAGSADANAKDGVRRTLEGRVLDARTGAGLTATLYVEGLETTVSSTPIPAASPTQDSAAAPGFRLGGLRGESALAGGFVLAQATDATPSPDASLSPGPDASPAASPDPNASPGASSPGPAGAASPGASPAVPTPAGTPYPLTKLDTDSKGAFEIKDLPVGTYAITVVAKGYTARTIQGALPTGTLELGLLPETAEDAEKNGSPLKGVVRRASGSPAPEVEVAAAATDGKSEAESATSEADGGFVFPQQRPGNYALGAWTTASDGAIDAFAFVPEVPLKVGRESRTVSPTLTLKAVSAPWILAGTVSGTAPSPAPRGASPEPKSEAAPDTVAPTSVTAYARVADGELPVATAPVAQDGYFRFKLPPLPEDASYHLVAQGRSESGQTVAVHRYDVTASDPKLEFRLPDAGAKVTVERRTIAPVFSWELPDSQAQAFGLSIETIGESPRTLWTGWTTGNALRLPAHEDFKRFTAGSTYRYRLTAVKLDQEAKFDLAAVERLKWQVSWQTAPLPFEIPKAKAGGELLSAPGPKPSPKPSTRYKPVTDL